MLPIISKLAVSILKRFPVIYAGVRAAYGYHVISRPPAKTPLGFKLAGGIASMENGEFEPEETIQVSTLLREAKVFVNVGANTGYYVCLARQAGAKVVAIEPLERNVQRLQRNVMANGWDDVEILPVGLGDRVALLKLYGGGTAASFVQGWAGASHDHYVLVPITTLDNVLGDRFCNEHLLILIDVEGFELNVLRGAVRQLTRRPAPVWFVEICIDEHQPRGERINPNLMETFEIFWKYGYTAERVGCETGVVSEGDVLDWMAGNCLPRTHNFVFRRESQRHLPSLT